MNIIPELNLNKTPNTVKNGSIIGAKNIAIDDSASYITNEYGFKEEIALTHANEKIVGCIPCNEEIVIFTYDETTSRIYRKPDNGNIAEIPTKWKWSGGLIVGDYTYNYKQQLVITVGEYDAPDNIKVPLKSWILPEIGDIEDTYKDYKICPDIPAYSCNYNINNFGGNLICGRYVYFIRFKIYDETYTNWFNLTDDIYIVNLIEKQKPIINYFAGSAGNYVIEQATMDNGNTTMANFYVHDDENFSSKSISLKINIKDSIYDEFQLGYIFKRESETVGRIVGNYDINTKEIVISTNSYIDEISIDDILKRPNQFYNVHNVKTYNNRIYIGNYEEEDIEDLQSYANNVQLGYDTINANNIYPNGIVDESGDDPDPGPGPEPEPGPGTNKYNITFNIGFDSLTTILANNVSYYEDGGSIYINNPGEFIRDYFLKNISVHNTVIDANQIINQSYDINKDGHDYHFSYSIQVGTGTGNNVWLYETDYADKYLTNGNSTYKIRINSDNSITFIKNNEEYTIDKTQGNVGIFILCIYKIDEGEFQYAYIVSNKDFHTVAAYPNAKYDIKFWATVEVVTPPASRNIEVYADSVTNSTPNYFNKTLVPRQVYNFFIHFIRKNGTYTNGYKINSEVNNIADNDFIAYKDDNNNIVGYCAYAVRNISMPTEETINAYYYKKIIAPKFYLNILPNNFIGYFITYEAVENEVFTAYCMKYNSNYNSKRWNSSAYLYNLKSIRGANVNYINDVNIENNQIEDLENVNRNDIEKHFLLENSTYNNTFNTDEPYIFTIDNKYIYQKKFKTLYRLTQNIYKDFNEDSYTQTMYLPAFYNREIILYYSQKVIGNITGDKYVNEQGSAVAFKIYLNNLYNYSVYPYFALSIKQDYEQAMVNFVDYEAEDINDQEKGLYYNDGIMPGKIKDFLELKACYTAVPIETYTNYSTTNIDTFPKTIYRSDTYSDENLNNAFREYQTDNYKNITENKGSVTNIVPISLNLLIHTEYSLFVFDRSPRLTSLTKTDIPDTFDVQYQELLNKSYGGLKDRRQSIITNFGYIWYDIVNDIIFRFDEGKINILSAPINTFLKQLQVNDVRFAFDSFRNRLIISLFTNIYGIITISYNFNTETFISAHDYYLTECFRTATKDYIFNDTKSNNKLYIYDSYEFDYKELTDKSNTLFDNYTTNDKQDRYIDLIYNSNYELPKVIESISYNLSNIINNFDLNIIRNTVEENLNRKFSGDRLYVYTDETCTGKLNINCDDGHNKLNDYKYPYWDKGKWNFNYFRNTVATTTKPTNSDSQSVIYGKYFVIRFIFNNNRRFKLESVEPKINIY